MENKQLFNLTSPQRNIYFREEYYKGTAINNVACVSYVKEEMIPEFLEKAVNIVVKKNEGLRLRITKKDDQPYQYLVPYKEEAVDIVDARNRSVKEIKEEIDIISRTPFEFEESKLYQFKFYLMPKKQTAMFFKCHHIIGDAWSGQLVANQIDKEYNNLLKKEFSEQTKEEKYSYLDFIKIEEQYLNNSKIYKKDKEYWEGYLENLPLGISFKDIAIQVHADSLRFAKKLPNTLSKKIDEYCKKNKITPYVFFLAIFGIYFYKTTGKTAFTIGTPVLNRKDYKEKQTVGMFVSTIPLKFEIDGQESIFKVYENISGSTLRALRYQRYPYEKMLDFVREKTGRNDNLFDLIFSFQNINITNPYSNIKRESFWGFMGAQQASFEMHIARYLENSPYTLHLDFKEGLTSFEERKLIFDRFITLIECIINSKKKDVQVDEINYISKKELNIITFSEKELKKKKRLSSIINRFKKMVLLYPNKVALKFGNDELTYKELNKKSNILGNYLISKGIRGNVPVALLVDRGLEMIVSILATLKVGAYYIPIDPEWPKERVKYIIKNSNAKVLITHKKNIKKDYNVKQIDVNEILKTNNNNKNIKTKTKINDLIYVLYTSGSTGKPKGVLISNKNVSGFINSMQKLYNLNFRDIWTLFHTYTFDFATLEIYGPLLTGGKLILISKEVMLNPKKLLNLIAKEEVSVLCQTPAFFYKMVEEEKNIDIVAEDLKIKYLFLGGESVYPQPMQNWAKKFKHIIINGYGPTETTVFSNNSIITKEDFELNEAYIGKPIPYYHVDIVNSKGELLPVGCPGELYISGIGVGQGYLNNEDLTKKAFFYDKKKKRKIYKTGDIGYYNDDGRIRYISRNDHQVKIRGFRVELQEIEKALMNCEHVSRAVVMAVDDDKLTKTLIGFIETKKENYIEEVIKNIRETLTPYMIPKLYQRKEFPLNTSGKIDRHKLFESIEDSNKNVEIIIKPKDELEKIVFDIVKKITKVKKISTTHDFINDLGLDSLDFMSLATQLSDYKLSIQEINDSINIQGLSQKIRDKIDKKQIVERQFEEVEIINKKVNFDLSTILLTGVTGFLGVHILREVIKNRTNKITYCLIRAKDGFSPQERLENTINEYFTDSDKKHIKKIKVIEGDFAEDDLGLKLKDYKLLNKTVKTVIHSGANVKHYGKYKNSYLDNVIGTKNIIKFCLESKAKMAHISTISVGGLCKATEDKYLDENKININQSFANNVYLTTKYEAEIEVLKAILENKIEAKIFRMGNIMPRETDGKFQKNIFENAFLSKIRTILNTKMITSFYNKYLIDMSPVDKCAEAIVSLLKKNGEQTIYHIFNDKLIKIEEILKDKDLKIVSSKTQIEFIKKISNPLDAHLLNNLINVELAETKSLNFKTIKQLEINKFEWKQPDKKYFDNLFKII